jgi:PD-(D/E)XK nuclease superfamily
LEYKNEFSVLLDDFSRLPQLEITPPTFMEIAGFPHYENVCSNILAYYLDTNQPHNLKTLVLKSLLQAISLDDLARSVNSVNSVQREEATPNSKRIDIVICADNVVIGIENKVYASLYNDLNEYSVHLHQEYKGVKNILKIVLSLNPIRRDYLTNGFVNLTYNTLFERIKVNLGDYYLSANTKDISYLMDFILTIQNLKKMTDINPEILKFFSNNKETIDSLIRSKNDIKALILQMVHTLKGIIKIPENAKQWVWDKKDLVHDFSFGEIIVAVDCVIEIEGFTITIWVRNKDVNCREYLNKLSFFKKNPIESYTYINNRVDIYLPKDLGFDTPLNDVAAILNDILKDIYC